MMDEDKLHNELNNRIQRVFDNYEDTTADEGWALLRQKFPEEKKDRGLGWLWYAAAAIVLLGIGLWFMEKPVENKNLVVKNSKTTVQPDHKTNGPAPVDSSVNRAENTMAQSGTQQQQQQANPIVQQQQMQPSPGLQQVQTQVNQLANNQVQKGSSTNPANVPPVGASTAKTGIDSILNKNTATNIIASNQQKPGASVKPADTAANANNAGQYIAAKPVDAPKPADAAKTNSAEAMNRLLAEKGPANKEPTKNIKRGMISVYAATYFNYAQGSENNINVGAGFSSDFRISNKLKLSTGLAIAQNSLKYNNSQPAVPNNGRANSAAAADVVSTPAQGALNQVAGVSSGTANAFAIVPTLKNYNASLIGLDLPINLKYQFNPQKSDTYISAGLSSGTFINETYILNYTSAQREEQNTTRTSFSGFDFAKTLNVSFGVGYPLGKSNRLIVEPFLKYPLDGLGSQQIKFGAGGINLKLNFNAAKK
jgi:hypothetical protein